METIRIVWLISFRSSAFLLDSDLFAAHADMIRLVCNTLRKLLCMSDEGYETFLMDLEDYKSELEERE